MENMFCIHWQCSLADDKISDRHQSMRSPQVRDIGLFVYQRGLLTDLCCHYRCAGGDHLLFVVMFPSMKFGCQIAELMNPEPANADLYCCSLA